MPVPAKRRSRPIRSHRNRPWAARSGCGWNRDDRPRHRSVVIALQTPFRHRWWLCWTFPVPSVGFPPSPKPAVLCQSRPPGDYEALRCPHQTFRPRQYVSNLEHVGCLNARSPASDRRPGDRYLIRRSANAHSSTRFRLLHVSVGRTPWARPSPSFRSASGCPPGDWLVVSRRSDQCRLDLDRKSSIPIL